MYIYIYIGCNNFCCLQKITSLIHASHHFDLNSVQVPPVRRPLPKPRHYPPLWVHEFRVVVDSSLVGLGYQLRICGADVQILDDQAPHAEIIQVSLSSSLSLSLSVWIVRCI